jgi:hypothetical protein
MSDLLYINGDSWTISKYVDDYLKSKNIEFVNKSVGGSSNLSIIQRTKLDLDLLKEQNIFPYVCISLSEVGRDLANEFSLVKPTGRDLDAYLKSVLLKEIEMLEEMLNGYQSYITLGWTSNPLSTKSIIDFIGVDLNNIEAYTISNGTYNWLSDRQQIFKFSKKSFISTVEKKQSWEKALLANQFIDESLHINPKKMDPVEHWIDHVISYFKK